ncbi:MAG: response regulator [Spirochaetaceae bacterium]|nr:MAG: response regulator [Spirochaetaceae bacterium]
MEHAPVILLVDDDESFCRTGTELLVNEGYRVSHVATGEEAVRTVCTERSVFDLILIDLDLGTGIDGIETARQILTRHDLPIVFLSSHVDRESAKKTETVRSYGLVEKRSGITVVGASINMALKLFRAQNALKKSARYRDLLQRLTMSFINLRPEEFDKAIEEALKQVGEYLGVDRVYVWNYDFAAGTTSNTHEWCAPGVSAQIANLQQIPLESIPEWLKPHQRGEAILIEDVASMPQGPVKDILESQEIRSVLTLPLMSNEHCLGFLGVDIVAGSENRFEHEDEELLKLLAELLVNVEVRRRTERELRVSEETRSAIMAALPDIIFRFDRDGTYLDCYAPDDRLLVERELVGTNVREGLPVSMVDQLFQSFRYAHETKTTQTMKYDLNVPAGSRSFEAKIVPMDADQTLFVARDVTETKEAHEQIRKLYAEKETLLRETQHRIKNNMVVMTSILSMQTEATENAEVASALKEATARFRSMQILYEKLFDEENQGAVSLGEYLQELVGQIAGIFPIARNVIITVNPPPGGDDTERERCFLKPKRISSVGLIVNELITNAMKHAFRDGFAQDSGRPTGTLHVATECVGDSIEISVEDNGPGMPDATKLENASGFGLTMVKALTEQLNGTIRFEAGCDDTERRGTRVTIRFPRARPTQ